MPPIEVKELIVNVNITENRHFSNDFIVPEPTNEFDASAKKEIISECVEKVMELLERKMNR